MMNTKQILAGVAVMSAILSINTPFARASGFYAGVFGGYDRTDADFSPGPSINANGGDFGILAGFDLGQMTKAGNTSFHASIEASYGWSSIDKSETSGGTTARVQKNNDWGVNIRPGIDIDFSGMNLKPYGIIGYRRAEFETTIGGVQSSKDYDGFELGIGTELLAYQKTGIRLDYAHVFYNDSGTADLDENDVRLSFLYHF